ncbi:hypothetical protein TWF696_009252 [Orbilia brochopaga]|uniref:Uncharacterized protein n=1 Tax=Orbilia brochopaga TaxID=3140254 RepID=A0AAV9UK41_9PEZI
MSVCCRTDFQYLIMRTAIPTFSRASSLSSHMHYIVGGGGFLWFYQLFNPIIARLSTDSQLRDSFSIKVLRSLFGPLFPLLGLRNLDVGRLGAFTVRASQVRD